jgi:hypothetical protein
VGSAPRAGRQRKDEKGRRAGSGAKGREGPGRHRAESGAMEREESRRGAKDGGGKWQQRSASGRTGPNQDPGLYYVRP